MRKNFTLKTRGVLCCCTGVEIILPCVFLAILCIPKLLVPDSVNNDTVSRPYQLATPWGYDSCAHGYKLLVVPDTADARTLAERAVVNLACDAARSAFPDAPSAGRGKGFIDDILQCGRNANAMRATDPHLHGALSGVPVAGAPNTTLSDVVADTIAMSAVCSDACLRDPTCYAAAFGDLFVPSMTAAFADEASAIAHAEANPGVAMGVLRFDAGVAGTSNPSSNAVRYELLSNVSTYATRGTSDSEYTREYFSNRWEAEASTAVWRKGAPRLRAQNAIDEAIIDVADGGADFSATLDVSVRPYPWLGYDYNLGGIIAAGVFGIMGTLAFMSNVVIVMKSVVVEKELRLREGMSMMGMSSNMYWTSWFFTHWTTAMCTVILLCLIGIYPFEYTNPAMQLIFYSLWVTSLTLWNYALSTFFSRSITASVVGCFVYILSIVPAITVRITHPQGSAGWLAVCLLPGSAINQWGDILARLELAKQGITFASGSARLNKFGEFSAWGVIGMTFLDCVIYGAATWYLDKVWPGEYGQRLPPWFPFTRTYWFGERHDDDDMDASDAAGERGDNFEPLSEEQSRRASVKIRGLRKMFDNGVVAVDNLTATFVPGQVSALLGHNGAGKTTTISILTGMLRGSGGDAVINGRSVTSEMPEIRASLGICPQFDVLWPNLTVREHLQLYAAFGGMDRSLVDAAVVSAVAEVALSEKLEYPAGKLSGGQRRKLSLAVAFIGRPSVAFLDEPTSGMDPYSRRFTWEVIRRRAADKNTTVVLTTHFLDEADLLCDRIAIMSAGRLACVGSPVFLKNRYGAGYRLTMARSANNPDGGADAALAAVRAHLPGATKASDVGAELSFVLPTEDTGKFPALFRDLDSRVAEMGFASYGISCTTLEEVFLSIARGGVGGKAEFERRLSMDGSRPSSPKAEAGDFGSGATKAPMNDDDDASGSSRAGYVTGFSLFVVQCRGLLWKRYLNWIRDARSISVQLVVPVLFFVLAMVLARLDYSEDTAFRPIEVSRARLLGGRAANVAVRSTDAEAAATLALWPEGSTRTRAYEPMIGCECNCPGKDQSEIPFFPFECCAYDVVAASTDAAAAGVDIFEYCATEWAPTATPGQCDVSGHGMDVTPECASAAEATFDGFLWSVMEPNLVCEDQDTAGCDSLHVESYDGVAGRYQHTVYAHQTSYHGLYASVNTANSAILRRRASNPSASIETTHGWLPEVKRYEDGETVEPPSDSTFVTSLFVVMGSAVLTSSLVVFPVYERRNNSKHLQMVSGIDKTAYWLCHWAADMAQMIVPIAAIMIVFAAFDVDTYRGDLDAVFVLLSSFVASSVTYTHLCGYFFRNEFYAFIGTVGMKLFLGVVTSAAGMVVELIKNLNDDTKTTHEVLRVLLPIIIPHYSLGKGLFDIGQNNLDARRMVYDAATGTVSPVGSKSWASVDVIGDDIAFLWGMCVAYGALILIIELSEGRISAFAARAASSFSTTPSADADDDVVEDEDVAAERARVAAHAAVDFDPERRGAETSGTIDERDGVILDGLTKVFGAGKNAKRAVKSLAVGMPRGQCFGLLGINGAGKTSTFRMITGEFAPTDGDTRVLVTSEGRREYLSVHEHLSRARQVMGYCPQFDGLQPNMTGREHLQFYARVRGVPPAEVSGVVESLLAKMDLTRYADKQAGTYSGGNKRKLSVAIALIGEPAVVLLDEPSTGMDPEARRFMWDVISASTKGRTVVLTSHSMEECEALCNRIGIMVGGRFSCLGPLQHLKNRFSEGYSVDLRFQPGAGERVYDAIFSKNLAGLEVVEAHETELKLRVVDPTTELWRIFEAVESLRTEPAPPLAAVVSVDDRDDGVPAPSASGGLVDDYSVSQTTLEQVFVRFAAKQTEETGAAPGLGGRFGGAAAAMDDDAPPPKKKGCCSCCCCCCKDY